MRERLLLGPVLVLTLLVGLALDQWLDSRQMPWRMSHEFTAESGPPTFPPGTVILPLMLTVAVLAVRELAAIMADKGIEASRRIMTFAAVVGMLDAFIVPDTMSPVDAVAVVSTSAVVVLIVSLAFYSRKKTVTGIVAAAGGTMLTFVYLGLMFGFLLTIRREHTAWAVLWVVLTIKACDIGAYFTGKAIGRHKLILWLSPGKTWEGLFGGVAFAMLVGAVGLRILRTQEPELWPGWGWALVPGMLFGFAGQAGDLIASLFKRDAGIKDSGKVLPGFGGILDVIDSPLLVAPLAYWWLRAMQGPLLPG